MAKIAGSPRLLQNYLESRLLGLSDFEATRACNAPERLILAAAARAQKKLSLQQENLRYLEMS